MTARPGRILVVDDIPDWRRTLRGLLIDEGYEVETAPSTNEAMALLETSVFDLALIDIRLEDQDEENTEGLQLAQRIRESWPSVKIVIITGYSTSETEKQAMEPPSPGSKLAEDYIVKERTADELA